MELRGISHFAVGAVHLHDIATSNGVTLRARVGQIQAVLALGNDFGEDVYAIIGAVEEQFTETALRGVFHPRARHLKGQQIPHHTLVGIGSQQGPVVVLAHAQNLDLLLLATLFKRLVKRTERIGLLITHAKRRTSTVAQCHITLIVDGLARMGNRIGIIELSVAVMDNLHASSDALITVD